MPERVNQGAVADLQPEDFPEQPARPLQADRLLVVQLLHQRGDQIPERRAVLQTGR